MTKVINGFAIQHTADGDVCGYILTEKDDKGYILRTNIRKSTAILDTDTAVKSAISTIETFINGKETA